MALITRTLTNTGAPLYSPNGALLTNTKVVFTLVDSIGHPIDAFDIATQSRVVGQVTTITDDAGIFSVELWPNDRGDQLTKYKCEMAGAPTFFSQVPSGSVALSWYNFKHSGAILTPSQISALDSHIADTFLHITPAQNTFLDALEVDLSTKENVGVAASLDAAHLITFDHINIAHSNRAALDLVTGTNTGDQDLTPLATKHNPSFTGDIRSVLLGTENVEIDAFTNPRAITRGVIRVDHKAGVNGTRPISLYVDANSFGDTSAVAVQYIATGLTNTAEAHVHNVTIDTDASTGGSVEGLAVSKTGAGLAKVTAVHAHYDVNPIEQTSGSLVAVTAAFLYDGTYTDVTASLASDIVNVTLFAASGNYLYLGNAVKFSSVNFSLSRFASGGGVLPTFEYSTGPQPNDWNLASPVDGTNGFRQNGTVTLSSTPTNWQTKDVNGVNAYWIRIRRTNAAAIITPIETKVNVDDSTSYHWDKDGVLDISKISIRNLQTFSTVANAISGGLTSGQVFKDTSGALHIV